MRAAGRLAWVEHGPGAGGAVPSWDPPAGSTLLTPDSTARRNASWPSRHGPPKRTRGVMEE